MAGITGAYLSMVERGLRDPHTEHLVKLCDVLGLSATALVFIAQQGAQEKDWNAEEIESLDRLLRLMRSTKRDPSP